jgi:hypothetical protein
MTTIPWGKHRGKPLGVIPRSYLRWLVGLDSLAPELRSAIKTELGRRGQRFCPAERVLADLEEEITAAISNDPAIDHATAAVVGDIIMATFTLVCERHGIGQQTELMISPLDVPWRNEAEMDGVPRPCLHFR